MAGANKPKRKFAAPPTGIKPSFHSGVLQTSTGIPTLDAIIGGGISMGSLLLVEEDDNGSYSKLIERCFLSAGVECYHHIFYSHPTESLSKFQLYAKQDPSSATGGPSQKQSLPNDRMKIAHQYQNQSPDQMMSRHSISSTKSAGTAIDLSTPRSTEEAQQRVQVTTCYDQSHLLTSLRNHYASESPSGPTNPRMLHKRVAFRTLVTGLGSISWEGTERDQLVFLNELRKLSPVNSFTVVTMPAFAVNDRHRRYFDCAVRLKALVAGLEPTSHEFVQSSVRKMGYHGLISVTKCNSSQCLNPMKPDSNEMAFKYKKVGGLHIETIHLPPEDTVQNERNQRQNSVNTSNKQISDMF